MALNLACRRHTSDRQKIGCRAFSTPSRLALDYRNIAVVQLLGVDRFDRLSVGARKPPRQFSAGRSERRSSCVRTTACRSGSRRISLEAASAKIALRLRVYDRESTTGNLDFRKRTRTNLARSPRPTFSLENVHNPSFYFARFKRVGGIWAASNAAANCCGDAGIRIVVPWSFVFWPLAAVFGARRIWVMPSTFCQPIPAG